MITIKTNCNECILLALCNKRTVLDRVDNCSILQNMITDQCYINSEKYDHEAAGTRQKTVDINLFNKPLAVQLTDYIGLDQQYIDLQRRIYCLKLKQT